MKAQLQEEDDEDANNGATADDGNPTNVTRNPYHQSTGAGAATTAPRSKHSICSVRSSPHYLSPQPTSQLVLCILASDETFKLPSPSSPEVIGDNCKASPLPAALARLPGIKADYPGNLVTNGAQHVLKRR